MRDTIANTFDPRAAVPLEPRAAELVQRRERLLGPAYRLFYERPLELVRGEGVRVWDADGNEYLDAYNNVPCVGHSHPRVAAAVARQLALLNTHTRYLSEPVLDYAERLLVTHDPALVNVAFTCTGSEAVDLALRIARHATGATGVLATSNAYHGTTSAAAEISPSLGPGEPTAAHVRLVPAPDRALGDPAAIGRAFAEGVAAAIADLAVHGIRPAALVIDSVLSTDGIITDPAGFLAPAIELVRRAGGLYVADEVQAGFGRTGEELWGYRRHAVEPDLVTMGKPMGNGLPIAAVAARREPMERFGSAVRYFNTFGGNAVCVAAASAVLDVIEDEGLVAHAQAVGLLLRNGIASLRRDAPALGEVRGAGLYLGVDIVDPSTGEASPQGASRIVNLMRDRRVLISATGPQASTLKIRPPLPFGERDADRLLAELANVAGTATR